MVLVLHYWVYINGVILCFKPLCSQPYGNLILNNGDDYLEGDAITTGF